MPLIARVWRLSHSLLIPVLALVGWAAGGSASQATVFQAWTQYADGGQIEARAITDDTQCPTIWLDGKPQAMQLRHGPDADFAVRSCSLVIGTGLKSLQVGPIALLPPVAHPNRIVVLGDSGCRLKGDTVQSCNDPTAWPFAQVAAHAAAEHPDLVIHVGDYFYRESPCPQGNPGCQNTPYGDNWPAWNIDVFEPATPLLRAATWIAVRGNHEECVRGGKGWTAFLGWGPASSACTAHEAPLLIDLADDLRIAVVDDNDADDKPKKSNPDVTARLHQDLAVLLAAHPQWMLSHHPVRAVDHAPKNPETMQVAGYNATFDNAFEGLPEGELTMHLSGHIHNFQYENFVDGQWPAQLVAGMGGDLLDNSMPNSLQGLKSGPATIHDGHFLPGFGYLVFERDGAAWRFTVHDVQGQIVAHCHLANRAIGCDELQ